MDRPALRRPALRQDALIAGLLALVLGAAWTWADRANLGQLRLPDTDDVVRLQQVRDWLAGQHFADLTQHRLGGGVAMHWSRLADLMPAAMIVLLGPLLGAQGAEVAAVVVSPLLLFAVALFLIGRIARSLSARHPRAGGGPEARTAVVLDPRLRGGDGGGLAITAMVVAAIGYPATTLFLPGRIDHHGLQMVLLLGATLALLRPATVAAGITTGLCAAASLAIGLETAPLFAAIGAVAVAEWALGRDGAAARLRGLGIGALAGLIGARGVFASTAWAYPACDGFTAQAWRAAMLLALVPVVLSALSRIDPSPLRLRGGDGKTGRTIGRAASALVVTGAFVGIALYWSPACLRPYGAIDPFLARVWLARVGEAQPLLAAPPGTALGYAGLMLAGIAATLWQLHANRTRGWAVLLALQLAALAITCVQLRGAYAGALLAAPALAAVIAAARRRGGLSIAAAWLGSAGMLYPLAAQALTPPPATAPTGRGDCASPALLAALDRLPTGEVIAPIDAGAAILAATRHRVAAAPYHRNDAGNRAAYRFYLGDPAAAGRVAHRWQADYWLACAAMPGPARAAGLPGWHPARTMADGATIFVRNRLSR